MRRRVALELTLLAAAGAILGARAAPRPARAAGAARAGARVVVIGGGFAGASCALELRAASRAPAVDLVDPDDPYVSCPFSNAALVGLRSVESLAVPRAGLERRGVRVIRDRIEAIDAARRRVRLRGGGSLSYDRLVFAAGIRFLWGQPLGYTEAAAATLPHAWQAGAQTRLLAAQIAALPAGGVVAISVPRGPMRCPPAPFERASLIAGFLRPRNPRAKVLILDANNSFPRQEVFTDAWRELYPGMIEWRSVVDGGAVERVDPAAMTLTTSQGPIRAAVINIIPPQAPAALAVPAGLASDHGWCPVDPEDFQSSLVPNVYVIGDACIAGPMPKAASAAHSQARRCARAILRALYERELPALPLDSVCYSALGADRALAIHARFQVERGRISRVPDETAAAAPGAVSTAAASAREARNAREWYERIVRESFGAGA